MFKSSSPFPLKICMYSQYTEIFIYKTFPVPLMTAEISEIGSPPFLVFDVTT